MFRPVLATAFVAAASLASGESAPPAAAEVDALIDSAQAFLLGQAQPNGTFMQGDRFVLGISGLAATALTTQPKAIPAADPRIAGAIAYVNGFRQSDGGVYNPAEGLGNYNTSIALMLWNATGGGDTAAVTAAQGYLFGLQNQDPKNPSYGGIGYGSKGPGFEP
jgi:hypothetical protein